MVEHQKNTQTSHGKYKVCDFWSIRSKFKYHYSYKCNLFLFQKLFLGVLINNYINCRWMKDRKNTGIKVTLQHLDSLSGHATPALPSYICLRLDESFFMNFLNASNRQLQDSENVIFILSAVLYFFCSIEVLADFSFFFFFQGWFVAVCCCCFVGLFGGGMFGGDCFFFWSQLCCFLILEKQSIWRAKVRMREKNRSDDAVYCW